MKIAYCAALAAVLAAPAAAQDAATITTTGTLIERPAAVVQPPAAPVARMMPAGTMLQVTPTQEITSKRIEEGDVVQFSVVADVVENGQVVVPRGTPVHGKITWKTGRAIGGKSGKFDVTFESVSLRGRQYALSGMHRQEGRGNTVGALLGSILITGRSAVMLPGQIVTALTASQIPY